MAWFWCEVGWFEYLGNRSVSWDFHTQSVCKGLCSFFFTLCVSEQAHPSLPLQPSLVSRCHIIRESWLQWELANDRLERKCVVRETQRIISAALSPYSRCIRVRRIFTSCTEEMYDDALSVLLLHPVPLKSSCEASYQKVQISTRYQESTTHMNVSSLELSPVVQCDFEVLQSLISIHAFSLMIRTYGLSGF